MEIVLLIAILAVAGSALFVAFAFSRHVTQNLELVRKADLDALIRKAVSDISGQDAVTAQATQAQLQAARGQLEAAARDQSDQASTRHDELVGKLESLDRHVGKLGISVARQHELIAGIEDHVLERGMQEVDPREMDALKSAVLHAEAYVARQGWGKPPRLFSLAKKSSLVSEDAELASELEGAGPDALIPVLQDDLPPGEPLAVLATIRWPEEVVGCVLVTEIVRLPPEAEKDLPPDPADAEEWAGRRSDAEAARLAVGVTRTGAHLCGLRLKGEDDIVVGTDLADDIVMALLETF
jgi:hypothetical protein